MHSQPRHYIGINGQVHPPAAFAYGKRPPPPPYILERRLDELQSCLGMMAKRKIFPLPRIKSRSSRQSLWLLRQNTHNSLEFVTLSIMFLINEVVNYIADSNWPINTQKILIRGFRNALTYKSLTPRSRVLLEKLTVIQLVKFPAFYGTRRFITLFTTVSHWSLSFARRTQTTPSNHTSPRSILILSSYLSLRLPNGLLTSRFPIRILYAFLISHACYVPRTYHPPWFDHHNNILWSVQVMKLPLCSLLQPPS
jgi:hypothetical protein